MNFPSKSLANWRRHRTFIGRAINTIALTLPALTLLCTACAHSENRLTETENHQRAINLVYERAADSRMNSEQKDLPGFQLTGQIVFQVLAAEIALQRGQLAPAYQTYLALAHYTHDPRMAERAAEIALGVQSTVDALAAVRLWHQYAPHSARAEQLNAILLVLNGQLDEAQPLLAAELAKIPAEDGRSRSSTPHSFPQQNQPLYRGNAILSLQTLISRSPDQMRGLRLLQALLKNDMHRAEAQFAIARQQILVGQRIEASGSLQKALKLKPDFEAAALLLAQLGPAQRKKAIEAMRALVQKEPASRNARFALAQLYLANDQVAAAQQEFKAAAARNPTDSAPLMALALIEIQQKHYQSAQRYLQYYLQVAQQQAGVDAGIAYLYLAQIAIEQKGSVQALQWLDKISATSAQYLPAQMMRAQIFAKTGNVEKAHQQLARLKSNNQQAQLLIALTDSNILFEARRYAQAEETLAKVYRAFPNEPNLIYDYAMAAEKNRHYVLMESLLRRLMTLQPNYPDAYNALGFSFADRGQRLSEAEKLLKKASTLAPNNPFIMDSVGWLQYRLGNYREATKLLRRAYQLYPNAEIGAHLGEVLWVQGQHQQAQRILDNAQQLEPDNETLQKTLRHFQIDQE